MVWVWLAVLLGVCVEATSNGVAMQCDVDNANLGSPTRDKVQYANRTMAWVLPPAWANEQYTLRTADPSTPATDPKTYTPGEWMNIYIRTTYQDQQFTGIILYATNANNQKVGDWQVPANAPFHVMSGPCVVHSNADPKNYLSVFKFKGPPVGSGTVTIKALIKFGLAFPSLTGTFFWPNSAPITLTERPQTVSQAWFQGEVGESCIDVCKKQGLGCDLPTMKAKGNSPEVLELVSKYSNCSAPVMPGCSASSPNVGQAGCFYHSDTCIQPVPVPMWTRNDPCGNLTNWVSGATYCGNGGPTCVRYKGAKWCCAYYTNTEPSTGDDYSAWGAKQTGGGMKGECMPSGGYPAGQGNVPVPVRALSGPTAITCEAAKNSVQDGQRICACSVDGQKVAMNSASGVAVPVLLLLFSVIASF